MPQKRQVKWPMSQSSLKYFYMLMVCMSSTKGHSVHARTLCTSNTRLSDITTTREMGLLSRPLQVLACPARGTSEKQRDISAMCSSEVNDFPPIHSLDKKPCFSLYIRFSLLTSNRTFLNNST